MNEFSSILFARPSFAEGASRILDFGNLLNEYNHSLSADQADELAIRADWLAIGEDFRLILNKHAGAAGRVPQEKQAK
jgi:hypothetical protein